MLTMSSKPLSAGQARTYHAREFASERHNYWSRATSRGSASGRLGLRSSGGIYERGKYL